MLVRAHVYLYTHIVTSIYSTYKVGEVHMFGEEIQNWFGLELKILIDQREREGLREGEKKPGSIEKNIYKYLLTLLVWKQGTLSPIKVVFF